MINSTAGIVATNAGIGVEAPVLLRLLGPQSAAGRAVRVRYGRTTTSRSDVEDDGAVIRLLPEIARSYLPGPSHGAYRPRMK